MDLQERSLRGLNHITEDSEQYTHDNNFSGSVKERGIFYWHALSRAH
jgi:hypothetical protein